MNNLFKILRNITLSQDEKAQMRRNIAAFMDMNPFGNTAGDLSAEALAKAERNSALARLTFRRGINLQLIKGKSMPALIIALIVALSGGTAVAAQGSLPGEALHPVKMVMERIDSGLSLSADAKANTSLKFAERRLEEAEKLAVEGKLDAELVAQMEKRFDAQEARMKSIIEKLEANGKTEAAARLSSNVEAMLNAHDEIVAKLKAKIDAGEKLVAPEVVGGLHTMVKDRHEVSKKLRADGEARVKPEFKAEAAANVKAMVENQINRVSEFIAKAEAEGKVSAEAIAEAKADLKSAQDLMAEGNTKLEAGANAEAFVKFMAAHRKAQEAQKVLRVRSELRLDMHRGPKDGTEQDGMIKGRVESDSKVEVKTEGLDTEVKTDVDAQGSVNLDI